MRAQYELSKLYGRRNPYTNYLKRTPNMKLKRMKKFKLTAQEKKIEKDLLRGVYKPVPDNEFRDVSKLIMRSSKRLVKLGGTEKKLNNIPRRRIRQNIHR